MTRTGQDAIDYARSRIGYGPPPPSGMEASGYCLAFVRECFAVGSYYASAIDAWNGAAVRHEGDRNPPPAVPVFFRSPSVYDHVAFNVSGSEVISTFNDDVFAFNGLAGIEASFDASYLGWTEDLNGVTVYTPAGPGPGPTPPPVPEEGDDRMEIIRIVDDGRIMVVGTYQFAQVPDMERYGALAQIWGTYKDVGVQDAQRMHDQVNQNLSDLYASLRGLIQSGSTQADDG